MQAISLLRQESILRPHLPGLLKLRHTVLNPISLLHQCLRHRLLQLNMVAEHLHIQWLCLRRRLRLQWECHLDQLQALIILLRLSLMVVSLCLAMAALFHHHLRPDTNKGMKCIELKRLA